MTSMAMLITIGYVVVVLSKQIPLRVAGFLSMDFSNVIIVIGGFIYGPVSAAIITVIVAFIEMITIGETGLYGFLMNVVNTCSFTCVAAAVYVRRRDTKSAITGLIVGCISVTATMMLWNYIITPLYMFVPRHVVQGMLVPVFLPYNLLKSGINAAMAFLLYRPIVLGLRRANLVSETSEGQSGKTNWGVMLAAAFILISLGLLFLVLAGVL